jgi:tellurite resistance protein TerC
VETLVSTNKIRALIWFGLGLGVGLWIAEMRGTSTAAEYYAAYFLEESLSLDNIFVFAIIFHQLHIPDEHRRRVLRFGIIGALIFRAIAIGGGIALITRFSWVVYPFAGLLLLAAWRVLFAEDQERRAIEGACDVCSSWIARIVPVSPVVVGHAFWRREGGRIVATPLFVALVVIETSDIVFALDSVPAVLSVSRDPLIVYVSNVMAMLGLRSLYFVIDDALARLRYLRQGLATILVFTAAKMLVANVVHIAAIVSVLTIGAILLVTLGLSALTTARPVAADS